MSVISGSIVAMIGAMFVVPGVGVVTIQTPLTSAKDSSFFGAGLLSVP